MAQALGRVRLYAATGVLCTALVVGLNILLLSVLRMGVAGYILSNVIADAVSAAALLFALRLWRSIRLRALPRSLLRGMLRYCLPLIPATVCTWIINISDRYFLTYVLGSDVSGLYALANKVASILLIASGIFTSAWNLSIAAGRSRAEKERFFSNVFSVYEACVWTAAAVLMASCRLIVRFLAAPGYFSAWHYAPVLILATAVACLGSFFSSVYVAEKRGGGDAAELPAHLPCAGAARAAAAAHPLGGPALPPLRGNPGCGVLAHAGRALRGVPAVLRGRRAALRPAAPARAAGRRAPPAPPRRGRRLTQKTADRRSSEEGLRSAVCLSVTPGSARCPPSSRGSGPRSPAGHRRPSC